jgi:hypothetical protein
MSRKEFQRMNVMENAAGGRLSVREASRLLELSEHQVQRLKRRYRPDSVGWVRHGNRGVRQRDQYDRECRKQGPNLGPRSAGRRGHSRIQGGNTFTPHSP